jgi:uncharacterized protein (UPF0335 family)
MHSTEASSLRRYIEEIENLEVERSEIHEHIADIYVKAKSEGFDPKIMKRVIKIKKMKTKDRENEDLLLETYLLALGLIPSEGAGSEG